MSCKEKEAVFRIKNQLVYGDVKLLLQSYQTEDAYHNFLSRISSLIEEDELFLASFPVSIGKILEIINEKRFELNTTNQVRYQENKIIVSTNTIKTIPFEEARQRYRSMQEILRKTPIPTDEKLIREVAYDIRVIDALKGNSKIILDQNSFLSSTAYLIEIFPEFYQQNPDFIEKSLSYIGTFDESEVPSLRKKAKIIRKDFKKYMNFKMGE